MGARQESVRAGKCRCLTSMAVEDAEMGNDILNSETLKQVGIRLLPDEQLVVAVELEGGMTQDLERSQATLVLTDRRLIRYTAGGDRNNVVSISLQGVDSIEVSRTDRNRQWVWVGLVFIAGGLLLGLLTLFLISSPFSPMLMAVSLTLIGAVFMLTYIGGVSGEVIVRAGHQDIKCRMKPKALDDMAVFVERYYELKLGYSSGPIDGTDRSNGAEGAEESGRGLAAAPAPPRATPEA